MTREVSPEHLVIIGGGPIGLTCALLLAQRRIASLVIDGRALADATQDARLLALSRGTLDILTPLLGESPPPLAAIREVIVSSAGDFGVARIAADDFDGTDLGATVVYGDLLNALSAAAARQTCIEVLRPMAADRVQQRHDRVEVTLADGSTHTGPVAIHAEGAPEAQRDARTKACAVLADLRLRPHRDDLAAGIAYERFTREGPLALLPTPKSAVAGSGRSYSLVWCMEQTQAQRRMQLDAPALRAEMQSLLGARIGEVTAIGPRRLAALTQRLRGDVHAHRSVALGNAAQALHPVAGQGFNLGVRDCVTLADELAHGSDAVQALARYAQRRRADRSTIAALTANLPAVFSSRFAPLAVARGFGLALLDAVPALRREFAQVLMFGVRI